MRMMVVGGDDNDDNDNDGTRNKSNINMVINSNNSINNSIVY